MKRLLTIGLLMAALTAACARPPMAVRSADDGRCPLEDDPAEDGMDITYGCGCQSPGCCDVCESNT